MADPRDRGRTLSRVELGSGLLLEGTGPALTSIGATGRELLDDRYEYLAVLRR